MKKVDEINDLSSCLNKARDDEMIFVLLGRDAAAIRAVRAWIEERIALGKNQVGDEQIQNALSWCEIVQKQQEKSRQ